MDYIDLTLYFTIKYIPRSKNFIANGLLRKLAGSFNLREKETEKGINNFINA